MTHPLDPSRCYEGIEGAATWDGNTVSDAAAFSAYLRQIVGPRVRDSGEGGLREVISGLTTTEMATEFVETLLEAVPSVEPWEVGEALAECVIRDEAPEAIVWPWNHVRDRRTPRASLPGADLVGFIIGEEGPSLLFGEVKTSSDTSRPPNVMFGTGGMTWQLEEEATRLDLQHSLLVWLFWRSKASGSEDVFNAAVKRYIETRGTHLVLLGVLLRDTQESERDVVSRARHLGSVCRGEMRVRVCGWYLPTPIAEWASAIEPKEGGE